MGSPLIFSHQDPEKEGEWSTSFGASQWFTPEWLFPSLCLSLSLFKMSVNSEAISYHIITSHSHPSKSIGRENHERRWTESCNAGIGIQRKSALTQNFPSSSTWNCNEVPLSWITFKKKKNYNCLFIYF